MKQKQTPRTHSKEGFVLGQSGFAKISAVEGIQLKPSMNKRAAQAADLKLSSEHRRELIVRAYRKA